jgi:hypothetical protein
MSDARLPVPRSESPEMRDLIIQTAGIGLDASLREHIRGRLQHKLARFAPRVERSSVLVRNSAGTGGDVEIACGIDVRLSADREVRIEERGATPREAFDRAATAAARALAREFGRENERGVPTDRKHVRPARTTNPPPEGGSYIGARVGRGANALARAAARPEKVRRDSLVDTAQPGVSASARKAGGGSTARRNTKQNLAGLTSALEDSAQDRPSRKSTRRSANRAKRDSNLNRRQTRKVSAPKQRARRNQVRAGRRAP